MSNEMNGSTDKGKKGLQLAVADIEKKYGKGSVMKMSDKAVMEVAVISTGSLGLDLALGIGGYPRGRIVEIYGPESSGKTTLAIHAIAQCQKMGGTAAFIDAEHAFDKDYAEALGVDVENLWFSQPDNGEMALDTAEIFLKTGGVDIIVIDSVAALTPRAEIDGDMGDSKMGLHARLMSQALRKITAVANKSNCLIIFINQLREKIGVMFGSPETTTGGNALKFYASVRLDVRRSTTAVNSIKDKDDVVVGNLTTVKVIKNKMAPPFKKVEFDIIYGAGIFKVGEILDLGVELKILEKSGSWFSYKGNKLGQGKEATRQTLDDNPELLEEIEQQIRFTAYGL